MAGEVAELDAQVFAGRGVAAGGGEQDLGVRGDEGGGEVAGGAEVEELEFLGGGVKEEVGPVGVGLHEAEFGDFAQAEAQDLRADPVFLVLGELVGALGDANAGHEVHC